MPPSVKKGSDRIKSDTLSDTLHIIGSPQSIEISSCDIISNSKRRNSSPLPALTFSVDEPSSSEDDSFGSEIELQAYDRLAISSLEEVEVEVEVEVGNKWGHSNPSSDALKTEAGKSTTYSDSDSMATPNVHKNIDRQDKEDSSSQSFWSFTSLFPVSSSTQKSADDAFSSIHSSNLFCGAPSWCMREPYHLSPIATRTLVDRNCKASARSSACVPFPYWTMEEDESHHSDADGCNDDDRYTTVSEPQKGRSNVAFGRRKDRIENLRFNLAPFSYDSRVQDSSTTKTKHAFPSKKIRSFTAVSGNLSSGSLSKKGTEPISCTTVSCTGSSHPVWDSAIMEEDGLCYDSDPGFSMPNRRDDMLYTTLPSPKKSIITLSSVTSFDEDMSMRLIMNHHFNLVWHRESDRIGESVAPTAVRFWMERGSCIRSALLQPKLCWQNIDDSQGVTDDRRYVLRSSSLRSIELLDVTKILPMTSGDKTSHPLAKKDRSFVIEASNTKYLFQAKDELNRDRIILGLKITISRLGSKIIMGDPNVFEEFFTPKGNEVPGDMPSVLRNE